MDFDLILSLGFFLFIAVVLVGFAGAIIYISSGDLDMPAATTTSTTTSLVSSTTTSTLPSGSFTTTSSTSTTTTLSLKPLKVEVYPERLYRFDDAKLNVTSGGHPVSGVRVYLDSDFMGETVDGFYRILSLKGGRYSVSARAEGYTSANASFEVDDRTYATSRDVHEELSPLERQKAIAQGKVNVRLYETSFCSNCAAVRSKLDPIVDANRECIAYEKLSYYRHSAELGGGALPFLIVEGPNGRYAANGLIPSNRLRSLIGLAGCDLS